MGQNQPGQGCYLIRRVKTCSSLRTNITSRLWSEILIEKILSARDKLPKIHQRFQNFWWIILHATYESSFMSHTKNRSYDQCVYLRGPLKLKFHHFSNPVGVSVKPVGVFYLTQPYFRKFCTILKNKIHQQGSCDDIKPRFMVQPQTRPR